MNPRIEETIIVAAAFGASAAVANLLAEPGMPRFSVEQIKVLLFRAASENAILALLHLRGLDDARLKELRAKARRDIEQLDETLRQTGKEAN